MPVHYFNLLYYNSIQSTIHTMLSKHPINLISKAQFIIECLLPSALPLGPNQMQLVYIFLATESIKLYYRLKRFVLENQGVLIEVKGTPPTDNWIKNWKKKKLGLTYPQIIAEIFHIFKPIIYLICVVLEKKKGLKSYIIFLILDLIRIGFQKPAQNQYQKFQFFRRSSNTVTKILFSDPFYSKIFQSRLMIPTLAKLCPNSPWLFRLFFYIAEVKYLNTFTI